MQLILHAIHDIAAQREACWPLCSGAIRTARPRTSGENLFVVGVVITPYLSTRISRMSADFFVRRGRLWHKYQRVVVNGDARGWNTQRVNRMMVLCGSILTAA